MKIVIIGAGAMGSLYGAKLSAVTDTPVCLLDVWQDQVKAINARGLAVEDGVSPEPRVYRNLRAFQDPAGIGPADLVIIFVKSTLTAQAVRTSRAVFGENTPALTLQNGLGNIEGIAETLPRTSIIAGTTAQGATLLGPGRIRHAGKGKTVIGELDGGISPRLTAAADLFNRAGLETEISANVEGLIWDKLLVNVGINALTAVTRLRNGGLLAHEELADLLTAAVTEGARVAGAKGIKLNVPDPVAHTREVCAATGENQSSMLQDILKGRPTEIDMINGAILREGAAWGIDVPVNGVLTKLVKFFEKTGAGEQEPA
ncbi:MAG: 2-dehydropantoate 2-reductase [Spirochaetaceae bacterium]|jgi:2-dehydropantoate 2-reductase|nr:2-dehydropantoate 2-reductase [Spirochaetaceae bacterium]